MEKFALKMTHKNGRSEGFDNGKDWYLMNPKYAQLNIIIANTHKTNEVRLFDTIEEAAEFNKIHFVEGYYKIESWEV